MPTIQLEKKKIKKKNSWQDHAQIDVLQHYQVEGNLIIRKRG